MHPVTAAHTVLADLRVLASNLRTDESAWPRHLAECRARVTTWRTIPAFCTFWSPIPHVAQQDPARFRYPLPGPLDDRWTERAGFDDAGRLVLVERPPPHTSGPAEVWDHASDTVLNGRSPGGAARLIRAPDGSVVGMVGVYGEGVEIQEWHRVGDGVARVDAACLTPHWSRYWAREADHDPSGAVLRIRGAEGEGGGTPDTSPAVLAEALARAAALRCDPVLWNAARHAYRPLRADTRGMAQQLADGLADPVAAAVTESGIAEPFCVLVRSSGDTLLPPHVLVGARGFRDSMRTASSEHGAAVSLLHTGIEHRTVALVDVLEYCDPQTLAACREINTGLAHSAARSEVTRATAVVDELGPTLARALLDRDWPGAVGPFLPLVDIHRYGPSEPAIIPEATRRVADPERVAEFERSITSLRGRRGRPPSARKALTDRTALARHLRFHSLDADAERLAHEVATIGLLLEPGGTGRSRLGGPPLLSEGAAWPHTGDGRPLTFLAALDLADVGPLLGEAWPASGLLLFYADIDPEHVDDLLTGVETGDASPARVFATDAPVPATAPPTLTTLVQGERFVVPQGVLTLPDGYEAWRTLGIDGAAGASYDEAIEALERARTRGRDTPEHWVGGHACFFEVPDPDTVLLLHMADDPGLGFTFLDGGGIQFRIARTALAGAEWQEMIAVAHSA